MTILVTGGAGRLGRAVVDRLLRDGHAVRVASRRPAPETPLPYDWRTVDYRSGGKAFRGYRQGGHLAPERAVGRITFDEFLGEGVRSARTEGSRR